MSQVIFLLTLGNNHKKMTISFHIKLPVYHKKPIKNCASTNNNEKETVPSFRSNYNPIKGCNNHGQSSKEFAL